MRTNEEAIAFEDFERGTFKELYFSPYKISMVPHHGNTRISLFPQEY
jgi:hypothetical protein